MINIIVAVAQNGVIGNNGNLPWTLKLDMARFKDLTMGQACIFGSATFNSLKRPLAGRENIVLSRSCKSINGAKVFGSLDCAVAYAKTLGKEIYICGGEKVYKEALAIADRIYLTLIKRDFDGDCRFSLDLQGFAPVSSQELADTGEDTVFMVYKRV